MNRQAAAEEGMEVVGGKGGVPDAKSGAASMLVGKVGELMRMHLEAGILLNNPPLLTDLCFSLSKGIDHAIANNEVPLRSRDLPPLLKQVYGSPTHNMSIQVGLMMLTMSIESACKLQWFSDQDTNDLLKFCKEVMKTFSDPDHLLIEPAHASAWVSEVMSRFYPKMKVERLLFSLELKPGFRFCVAGFPITRGTISPKEEKVYLLVAQVDSLRTSCCIISPPEANFLLNGHGVEGRTIESVDKAPQLPTNITRKLKFGINCLQAIGQFNGNFLLVIAVMTATQSCHLPELKDSLKPIASVDSEAHDMEMSSRISLNCPISKSRIKTPVKGKYCKHLQCFDDDNFLEINSRIPFWGCPHCKQPVCYVDLCIDHNFLRVLGEAEEKVVNVIMSANGSWKEDQICGDSQLRHQNDNGNSSLPKPKIPSKAPVNNDSHENSVQLLQQVSSLHAQRLGGDTGSIRPPLIKQQRQQQSRNHPHLNTSEALNYTENVVHVSAPLPTQPEERCATILPASAFQQPAAHLPEDIIAPPITTPGTSSRLNPSAVAEKAARRIRNDEPHTVAAAVGEIIDWRPTNRMRGSLTGEAYSAALQKFIVQPTQRAQAASCGPLTNAHVAVATRSASPTEKSSKPS